MSKNKTKGTTFIETLVTVAVIASVFAALIGYMNTTLTLGFEAKAQAGAKTLAQQHMEYIRSLDYEHIGTIGGVPSGVLPQEEEIQLNGIKYKKRTVVLYVDDPADGVSSSDSDANITDYKVVKTHILWDRKGVQRGMFFVSYFAPKTIKPQSKGTLKVKVLNSHSEPVPLAKVHLTNPSTTPAVDMNLFTNTSGEIEVVGLEPASGYNIKVTKDFYSSDETTPSSATLADPAKPPVTITKNQTTIVTFFIDLLSKLKIFAYTPHQTLYEETFASSDNLQNLTNVVISNGYASKADQAQPASFYTKPIGAKAASWDRITITATGTVNVKAYDKNLNLIPDTDLPGNSTGFSGEFEISYLNPKKYPQIVIGVFLDSADAQVDNLQVSYAESVPVVGQRFRIRGEEQLGTNAGESVYKFDQVLTTDTNGEIYLDSLRWDNYHITPTSSTRIIKSICPAPTVEVPAGASETAYIELTDYTPNALRVVVDDVDGNLLAQAQVILTKDTFSTSTKTNYCGQAFFDSLASGQYILEVQKPGYTTASTTLDIFGNEDYQITLTAN